jgi:hypothetical protein
MCPSLYKRRLMSHPHNPTFNITVVYNWIVMFLSAVIPMFIDYSLISIGRYDLFGRSAPRGDDHIIVIAAETFYLTSLTSCRQYCVQTADRATELKLMSLEMYKSRVKSCIIMHSALCPLNTWLNSCTIFHQLDLLLGPWKLIPGNLAVQWTILQIHIPDVPGLFLGPDVFVWFPSVNQSIL